MEQLKGLSLGRQLILGAGVLLFIDTLLNWQQVNFGSSSIGQNAWHGFWGVLMALMVIALVLWTAARAFNIALPAQIPDGLATLALGVLIPIFALLKAITDARGGLEERIYLRADKKADYGTVAKVMGLLSGAGFKKLALVTEADQG